MVIFKDELYVAGIFDEADGISTRGIAKWDGRKWCTVKDHFDDWLVQDVAAYKGELYVGGGWYSINGDSSFNHLAKYIGSGFNDDCSVPLSVTNTPASSPELLYPNPANGRVFIRAADINTISILDITGRNVLTLPYDVNGIDISRLAAGIYTVRMQGQGIISTAKLIKH